MMDIQLSNTMPSGIDSPADWNRFDEYLLGGPQTFSFKEKVEWSYFMAKRIASHVNRARAIRWKKS